MKDRITTLKHNISKLIEIEKAEISINDISEILGSGAGVLLAIILAAPMCLPFANIPGFAQVVSLGMGSIFYRFMIGKETIWLPKKVKNATLTKQNLNKICNFLLKSISKIEHILKPRLLYLSSGNMQKLLYAFCISMVVILSLPLVIPLTNFFPALSLLLINFGILQRDGYVILSGVFTGIFSVFFIIFIVILGIKLVI